MKKILEKKKSIAEDVQDSIFSAMSADKKIEVATKLWQLGKALSGDKIDYGRDRSETATRKGS